MIYTGQHLNDLDETVKQTIAALRPHVRKFDSIVVRGLSGVLIGSPVSLKLNRKLVVVRKESEQSHSQKYPVLNYKNIGKRWIFLDDLVESGKTRKACQEAVGNKALDANFVGQYLYGFSTWTYWGYDKGQIP